MLTSLEVGLGAQKVKDDSQGLFLEQVGGWHSHWLRWRGLW